MVSSLQTSEVAAADLPERRGTWFSAFAIALGLALILGFLSFLREPPNGSFHGEWTAAIFFACAAGFILPVLPKRLAIDIGILAWPLVLTALLAIQFAAGFYSYEQDVIIWIGYLALAMAAMLLGQGIRAAGLVSETAHRLAWTLVIASTLNVCAQIIQALHVRDSFAPFVVRLVEYSCRTYGNIGQANHATTLAWLGLGATLYLHGVRKLASPLALLLIAVLLIGSALTASRMAWLFLGVTAAIVVFLPAWPANGWRARVLIASMLVCGFAVASIGAGLTLSAMGASCGSSIERLAGQSDGGMLIRLELWRQAVDVWLTSPWIGVGVNRFLPTVYAIESLDVHQPLDMYPHNLALQILAEFGMVGAGAVGTTVMLWALGMLRSKRDLRSTDAVFALWLAVIGAHALLEFPLSYTHFLLLFCLVLGLLVRPGWSASMANLPLRGPLSLLVIALLAGSAYAFYDYRKLDRLFWIEDQRRAFSAAPTKEVRALLEGAAVDVWLYRPIADHLLGLSMPLDQIDLALKIEQTDRLLQHSPHSMVMARRVALAILADDIDAARLHLRRMFGFFAREQEVQVMVDLLRNVARKRPDEFAALGPVLDEELDRRPPPRW